MTKHEAHHKPFTLYPYPKFSIKAMSFCPTIEKDNPPRTKENWGCPSEPSKALVLRKQPIVTKTFPGNTIISSAANPAIPCLAPYKAQVPHKPGKLRVAYHQGWMPQTKNNKSPPRGFWGSHSCTKKEERQNHQRVVPLLWIELYCLIVVPMIRASIPH